MDTCISSESDGKASEIIKIDRNLAAVGTFDGGNKLALENIAYNWILSLEGVTPPLITLN